MPRNLVLFCDGTANKFGQVNTNVVRIVQSLVRDDDQQLVYYDPGVGTMPGPGLITHTGRFISKVLDLAFATSLDRNVQEAYTFLMNNYEPGDKVFLFGFSRGAYTVRVVAALMHHIGLLPRGSENLIPYALRLLRIARKDDKRIGDRFRDTFARPIPGRADRCCPVHFMGIWDTVSSVGWFWEPEKFRYTAKNPSIAIIRHAISIDERRAFYRQNRVARAEQTNQDLKQMWFAGVHADVGGGYEDATLGRCPLDWIFKEARDAKLHLDDQRFEAVAPRSEKPWMGKAHNELIKPWWWLAEFFPKLHWNDEKKRNGIRMNLFRSRRLKDGELLHESLLKRIQEKSGYRPASLSREFCAYVAELPGITEPIAYWETRKAPARPPSPSPVT